LIPLRRRQSRRLRYLAGSVSLRRLPAPSSLRRLQPERGGQAVLAWGRMDPASALADLIEISSQVEAAVLLSTDGSVIASTIADEPRANALAAAARRLFDAAEEGEREGPGARPLTQLEAATLDGSVFVVRDGERLIAAVTAAEPTVGLVFYDLKTCLRQTQDEQPAKAAQRRLKAAEPLEDEPASAGADEANPNPESAAESEESSESPTKPKRTRKQADAAP
jgi:predicted regulator of Ras-like GTPase activity (Roadblock/LC7/MglB family)